MRSLIRFARSRLNRAGYRNYRTVLIEDPEIEVWDHLRGYTEILEPSIPVKIKRHNKWAIPRRLEIECLSSAREFLTDKALRKLKSLRDIDIMLIAPNKDHLYEKEDFDNFQNYHEELNDFNYPNLHHLKINIFPPANPTNHRRYKGFQFTKGTRLPSLESLDIGARHRHVKPRNYDKDSHPLIGEEQHHWADNVDWAAVKQGSFSDLSIVANNIHKLISLEKVLITDPHSERVAEFLREVPVALQNIQLRYLPSTGVTSILRHGSRLHTFGLRTSPVYDTDEIECRSYDKLVWPIDSKSLESLRDSCRNIEDLAIDVDEDSRLVEVMESFPKLHTLSVFYPFAPEEGDGNSTASSYMTASRAKSLFEHLRRSSPIQPSLLTTLNVSMTGFMPPTANSNEWSRQRYISFACKLSAAGKCTVYCEKLEEKENEVIQAALDTGDDILSLLEKHDFMHDGFINVSPEFKYAWEGPLKQAEWKDYDGGGLAHRRYFKDGSWNIVGRNDEEIREMVKRYSRKKLAE